jgi:hypothetical protein
MKSFKEGKLVLWMPKSTKIKGGKFTLPENGPFKIQKMFDNNTMELSTISDERAKRININKLKAYQHNNPPTNVIIEVVTVDTRPSGKIRNRHRKKTNLIFHLTCIPNRRIYLIMTQNLEKHLMKMILSRLKKKIPKVAYQECLKMKDQQKFNYKGRRKGTILLYSKNYVNEKGGHKNRKVGLEPRLVCVKETVMICSTRP